MFQDVRALLDPRCFDSLEVYVLLGIRIGLLEIDIVTELVHVTLILFDLFL